MKAQEYKAIKKEAEEYIRAGRPLAAAHVHEQHALEFTEKQYYELHDIICKAAGIERR